MVRKINQEGLDLIKTYEGYRSQPYVCPAGYLTVGYGHVIKEGEDFSKGVSPDVGEMLLEKDLEVAERAVSRLITTPLTDNQYSALVSFTFNLGAGTLQASTLRKVLNRGEYTKVPKELKRWIFVNGRKSAGLIKRRKSEVDLWRKEKGA